MKAKHKGGRKISVITTQEGVNLMKRLDKQRVARKESIMSNAAFHETYRTNRGDRK